MITILLATYNGERHLREQLDSLLDQIEQGFRVVVHDDCSTDGTWAILREYAATYPGKFLIRQNPRPSGGAKHNFFGLMLEHRDSDYFMLCDQDDVWQPDKIAMTLEKMRELEAEHGTDTPYIVHTDLRVVDDNLQTVHSSFKAMSQVADLRTLKQVVMQNHVTGCTAMYNRALANYLNEVPTEFVMHDWWLAMVNMCFGRFGYVAQSTILYRQHGGNYVGAMETRGWGYKWYKLTHVGEIRSHMRASYLQAAEFLRIYRPQLGQEQLQVLEAYEGLTKKGKLGRMTAMLRKGLLRKGLYRALSQLFFG